MTVQWAVDFLLVETILNKKQLHRQSFVEKNFKTFLKIVRHDQPLHSSRQRLAQNLGQLIKLTPRGISKSAPEFSASPIPRHTQLLVQ